MDFLIPGYPRHTDYLHLYLAIFFIPTFNFLVKCSSSHIEMRNYDQINIYETINKHSSAMIALRYFSAD